MLSLQDSCIKCMLKNNISIHEWDFSPALFEQFEPIYNDIRKTVFPLEITSDTYSNKTYSYSYFNATIKNPSIELYEIHREALLYIFNECLRYNSLEFYFSQEDDNYFLSNGVAIFQRDCHVEMYAWINYTKIAQYKINHPDEIISDTFIHLIFQFSDPSFSWLCDNIPIVKQQLQLSKQRMQLPEHLCGYDFDIVDYCLITKYISTIYIEPNGATNQSEKEETDNED